MPESDPIAELAPFIQAARITGESFIPPDGLSDRLIAKRTSPIPEENLPATFGPYTLEKVLGRGASGTVYQAFDPQLGRHIAVKILAPELANLPDSRQRFLREGRAAAALQHENLMPLFAVHEDTPLPSLCSPLLHGETLQQKIDRDGPLSANEIHPIALDITHGLQHAHDAGIIHRDIKPSNIFYDQKANRAIIMDFGLSHTLNSPSNLTLNGTIVGTPEFLAPEQIDDSPNLTPAADFYALGSTLYALATGNPPFAANSLTSLLKKVATDSPPNPKTTDSSLNQLILSLLSKNPKERPANAKTIASQLQPNQRPKPTFIQKTGLLKILAAVITLSLISFLSLHFLNNKRAQTPPSDFDLFQHITSNQTNIIIEKSGIHTLPSLNLSHELTITANQPNTILDFKPDRPPFITTTKNLTFKNLTIRLNPSPDSPLEHGIVTSGQNLNFINCRIEHRGHGTKPGNQLALILAHSPINCQLTDCQLFAMRSPLFRAPSGSSLKLKKSLLITTSLLKASSEGGQIMELDHCTAITTSLAMANRNNKNTKISAHNSYLETNQAFLWVPAGELNNISNTITWSGNNNTFATSLSFLSLAKRGFRMEQHDQNLTSLTQWQKFWKTDSSSQQAKPRYNKKARLLYNSSASSFREKNFPGPHQH